ncbi:MAG TPA: hypothetical protein VMT09_05900 [Steroidobacteraceae bacterium]|nr:hypothetical protein [Steroidobacteraceae bacterium]
MLEHRPGDAAVSGQEDVAREQDDPMTRGLRERAIHHLDEAIRANEQAIKDVEKGR